MRVGISGLAVSNAGGLGRLARTSIIALAVARPGWELHVYLRHADDVAALHEECGSQYPNLVDTLRIHLPPPAWRARVVLEDLDLPRQFAPLKLDAYLGLDFTLPTRRLAPVEAVILPDLIPFTQPATVSLRARLLYRRGIRRAVERGARLVCISEKTRKELEQQFPQQMPSSFLIHPALSPRLADLTAASAVHDHPLQVRGIKTSLSEPGRFLLYVGDCGVRKNVALLVRVYRSMVEEGQYSGSLVLAGGDGRFCTVKQRPGLVLEPIGAKSDDSQGGPQIYDLGRVTDSDLSELYANADLLVSLSSEEGFGYPVLEAIAHGTPAVVTRGSAMEEAAPAGIVTTALEPEAAAATIAGAVAALPVLRQEVHAIERGWFNIERMGEQLAQVLES